MEKFLTCETLLRIISIFLVTICALQQGLLRLWRDPCQDLISPPMRSDLNPSGTVWKPSHCSLHNYTNEELFSCFRNQKLTNKNTTFIFLGDSHERQIFVTIAKKIDPQFRPKGRVYTELSLYNDTLGFQMNYTYMPTLNDSYGKTFQRWEESSFVPDLVVIGCNLHPILDSNASSLLRHEFRKNLTNLIVPLDIIARKTSVLWYIQPPVIDEKIKKSRQVINNFQVTLYNTVVRETVSRTRVKLWTSAREIAIDNIQTYSDDVHVARVSLAYYVQILTNLCCNERFSFLDGTCCKAVNTNMVQDSHIYLIILLTTCLVSAFMLWSYVRSKKRGIKPTWTNIEENGVTEETPKANESVSMPKKSVLFMFRALGAVFQFGLCVTYVYLCDSVPLFPKMALDISPKLIFGIAIGIVILASGLQNKLQAGSDPMKTNVLDETRGLVITLLLLLKMSQSNLHWSANILTHVSESSLVVLSGYGLFLHSWSGKSMNFCYYFQSFASHNILAVTLCVLFEKRYIFYEIVPLILVSHTLTFAILVLPPRPRVITREGSSIPENIFKVDVAYLCKICIIGGALFWLHRSEEVELKLFSVPLWRRLFLTKEDTINSWQLRWQNDKFSFVYGAIIGIVTENVQLLTNFQRPLWGRVFSGAQLLGSMTCFYLSYCIIEKDSLLLEGGGFYPLLLMFTVVGYVLLRSTALQLRSSYSVVLARLGRLWLEIYLLHVHIWSSNDGRGLLVLLPFNPVANLGVATFILLVVARNIRDLYSTLCT